MELGQYQLEIFAGLMVIPGAALYALFRDSSKGNHGSQFRELFLLLKKRPNDEDWLLTGPVPPVSSGGVTGKIAGPTIAESKAKGIFLSLPAQPKGGNGQS
jgi:hypothetical protein